MIDVRCSSVGSLAWVWAGLLCVLTMGGCRDLDAVLPPGSDATTDGRRTDGPPGDGARDLAPDLVPRADVAVCGNGKKEPGEACDGTDLGGQSCADVPGFFGGTLGCTKCRLDTSGCDWLVTASGPGGDAVRVLAADAAGNVYVAGELSGTMTIGGKTLTAKGAIDTFLAKLDPSGKLVWINQAHCTTSGGGSYVYPRALAWDNIGNLWMAGIYLGTATFAGQGGNAPAITGNGGWDGYLLLLDSAGTNKQIVKLDFGSVYGVRDVAADAQGNAVLSGYFDQKLTIGSLSSTANGPSDLFVARVTPAGKATALHTAGGAGDEFLLAAAVVDGGKAVHLTGRFTGTTSLGSATFAAKDPGDLFVARMDSAGKIQWAARAGGSKESDKDCATKGCEAGYAIAVSPGGQTTYVSGMYHDTADFGTTTLTAEGQYDLFVARLDDKGRFTAAITGGGPKMDVASALGLGSQGQVFVSGSFDGSLLLGGGCGGSGPYNLFLAALDPSLGQCQWAVTAGGGGLDSPAYQLLVDAAGRVTTAGYFEQTATFTNGKDQKKVTSAGSTDGFIMSFTRRAP